MAALTAAVAAAFTSLHLSRPLNRTTHLHFRTLITCSLSTSSKPDPVTNSATEEDGQLYIPWIVNGNSAFMNKPPPSNLLMESTGKKSTKKMKEKKIVKARADVEVNSKMKLSKAARRYYNENYRDQPQRLAKVLACAGVASRRSCEELIFEGKVTVNGSVCNTPQTKVDPGRDVVYVNGSRLPKKLPPKVYLALNKPKGYICSSGEKETKSVLSLFSDFMERWDRKNDGISKPRLFTVGRLDVNTTGLIIVTNDGEFAHKLSHPSFNLSKEYIVTIDGEVNKRHLLKVSEGTIIEGVQCTPDVVELLPKQPDISRPRLRIVVHEGRHHEVREIVKHAGLQVYTLKRVRIGGFRLPSDLGIGKHAELTQGNLRALGWKA
ncbi:hypothetical protein LIER_10163 [Lithospermum erythrorhizon]|uniref:RNA-binding S4 domain-containing protein n=1 Tax=Lithospermum erythrorhizon TaxID=34254 RepID=A0AAV3PI76_LITER